MIAGANGGRVWLGLVIDVRDAQVVDTTGPCTDYEVAKVCAEYMAASARAESRRVNEDCGRVPWEEYVSQVVAVDLSELPGSALPQPDREPPVII